MQLQKLAEAGPRRQVVCAARLGVEEDTVVCSDHVGVNNQNGGDAVAGDGRNKASHGEEEEGGDSDDRAKEDTVVEDKNHEEEVVDKPCVDAVEGA